VPFPCQKGGMGVKMQVLVRISPNFLFPDIFRVKPCPSKQKKGGSNLPLKDLVCGPVCWAKMVHFWKPCKQAFWPSSDCWEPFSMLPRHALSSIMVWNAGVRPWWAATAEIFNSCGLKLHCLPTPDEHAKPLFTRQTSNVLSVTSARLNLLLLFQNMPLTTFTSYNL